MALLSGATWFAFSSVVLVAGLAYASYTDIRTREVPDALWVALCAAGILLALAAVETLDPVSVVAWVLAGTLVLEHLVPWDVPLEKIRSWLPGAIEVAFYALATLVFVVLGLRYGLSFTPGGTAGALPIASVVVVVSVFLARGLFEVGVLYGGADAKALMVAGILVPLGTQALISPPAQVSSLLAYYPFAVTVLMNAAFLSVSIPVALALVNARRREFSFPRGFLGYWIPVRLLPDRFVWIKDPLLDAAPGADAATTEDDHEMRKRQMEELTAKGVDRVWVTPQLPFVVLLYGGVILGLMWGNVVLNIAALA